MNETQIREFWQAHPCGDQLVGGLSGSFAGNFESFFSEYDRFRYNLEPHILAALDRFEFAEKRVLEVGIGQGADSEQLIRRGARWSGLDLTQEAVDRMKTRAALRDLPIEDIKVGSALAIPYSDASFDVVFSHGVLHHIPDIRRAQSEIRRVLKPNGSLIIMVYAKHSLNYHFSIRIVRRLGLILIYCLPIQLPTIFEQHRQNARRIGMLNYLRMSNFVHRSTDGPENPYSKVYTLNEIERDFTAFRVVESFKRWLSAPPLPTRGLPGGKYLGWHLWARLQPRAPNAP